MRILVIQSGPIDKLVQSTPLLENLNRKFPGIHIDIAVHPNNQEFFDYHPFIKSSVSWDKSWTYKRVSKIVKQLNTLTYDYIFNLETGWPSGLLTYLLKGKVKIGFKSNLFAFAYTYKATRKQVANENIYNNLLKPVFKPEELKPTVYPDDRNFHLVKRYKKQPYVCVAPVPDNAMLPVRIESWVQFIKTTSMDKHIYLLGRQKDWEDCENLVYSTDPKKVHNFAGKLSILEIAALLKDATNNYLNNAGLRSVAKAVNAPVNDWDFQQAS